MSDVNDTLAEYVADHPRMIGALFTILLLLSQIGTVAGNMGSTIG